MIRQEKTTDGKVICFDGVNSAMFFTLLSLLCFMQTNAFLHYHPPTVFKRYTQHTRTTCLEKISPSVSTPLVEDLNDLEKESFFCYRTNEPSQSTCIVECKRRDGKPLGFGMPDSDDDELGDVSDRRAFVLTSPAATSRGTPYLPPCVIHIRQLPFSSGKLGGSLWYAAIALSQHISTNPHLVKDKRVLELGAGVGLPGLAAAKCSGARSVTLTEFGYDEDERLLSSRLKDDDTRLVPSALLENLRYNAKLNGLGDDVIRVRHLDWYDYGMGDGDKRPLPLEEKYGDQYDLVIGSDLVNWEDDVEPLINTLKYFLSKGATAVIALSNENRQALPTFLDLIREEFATVNVEKSSLVHYDEHPMLLITLTV